MQEMSKFKLKAILILNLYIILIIQSFYEKETIILKNSKKLIFFNF